MNTLKFKDYDQLKLAITSASVPEEVSVASVSAIFGAEGEVWATPSVRLSKKTMAALANLGVVLEKAPNGETFEFGNWLRILPLETTEIQMVETAPVLFLLKDSTLLSDFVGEILRLGNDRQSYRWLGDSALLRVIGPPYYSLLRAVDNELGGSITAYVERAPKVWVQVGFNHPLINLIKAPEGQIVLLNSPHKWIHLEDKQLQDIYQILEFSVPSGTVKHSDKKVSGKVKVPLKLVLGSSTEADQLWVLKDEAHDVLDTFVREAKDEQLDQLSFAVAGDTVILKSRPSKKGLPIVELKKAVPFRPFSRLTNLFIPKNLRIHPPLRRDAVRDLLANDPDVVTWLYPKEGGGFTPESISDNAFRPLADWVDYVVDTEQKQLEGWIESSKFDFANFMCKEDLSGEALPKTKRTPKHSSSKYRNEVGEEEETSMMPALNPPIKKKKKEVEEVFAIPEVRKSQLELRLRELENKFISMEGAIDSEERLALWPELAAINTALDRGVDASICWSYSLWADPENSHDEWLYRWTSHENNLKTRDIKEKDFDRIVNKEDPTIADVRSLASLILYASEGDAFTKQVLKNRLPAVRTFLEKWENLLGIRVVWLVWVCITKLSSDDVLGLARVRDRLLNRLLANGMSIEHDLPSFLRYAGHRNSDRYRAACDQIVALRTAVHNWISTCYKTETKQEAADVSKDTKAYVDLIFSFGVAKLGEDTESRKLEDAAKTTLDKRDDVHTFLLHAFEHRIHQARDGKPHTGPLPADQLELLAALDRFPLYKVDRLRRHSRILEPQEKVDPYRKWYARTDDLTKDLVALTDVTDPKELQNKLNKHLKEQEKKPKQYLQVLTTALELGPRISEAFTIDILNRVGVSFDSLPPVQEQRDLQDRADTLERALFLAAHYDRVDHVQKVVENFASLLDSQKGQNPNETLANLAGQCLKGLRKVGLKDEIEKLFNHMVLVVLGGKSIEDVKKGAGAQWMKTLTVLLQIASGWFYFGRGEKAFPIIAEAEGLLFDASQKYEESLQTERTRLICAYAMALGQAPVDTALAKYLNLFKKLSRLSDTFTTNSHYCLSQLQVVESVIMAIVSEDFNLGQNFRKWLDEDEYLVRQKIHADLRLLMHKTGV